MEKEKRTEIELYWIRYILRYITVVHFTCVREGLVPNLSLKQLSLPPPFCNLKLPSVIVGQAHPEY